MKKRILCFVICAVMLLAVTLTGCKKKEEDPGYEQIATTLSMWVVTENEHGVDDETAKIVSDAINSVTNSRFKVRLVINWLTKDEYRAKLDRTIRDYIDVRATKGYGSSPTTVDTAETSIVEEQTEVNEWGFTVVKYPALEENQVDIIYIEGEDMYLDYINRGWLFKMDDELTSSSKKIKEYVNPYLLSAAKRNGGTYAIPNNRAIGSYTVMLLNKELMAETDMDAVYKQGRVNGFFNENVYNYLETVRFKNDPNVVPIASEYEDCLNLLAHYWNIDPDTLENREGLSILGYRYENLANTTRNTALRFDSLFTDENFTDAVLKLKEYQLDGGYFGVPTDTQTAALTIKEMNYAEYTACLAENSEYYPVILKNPTVKAEDVYESMFGVCSKTKSTARSMEILTFLNTNSDFRNLLQYGVEGETYRLETDPLDYTRRFVELLPEHPYKMDVFKTGNAFIAYPEPGMPYDEWENGREQNLAVPGADPLLDLSFRSIAEASIAGAAAPSVGSSGYTYTYTGGLSREIIAQNSALKEWLDQCDARGKGTYALITSETSGQNTTSYCYFYNNEYSGTSTATDGETAISVNFTGNTPGSSLGILSIYSRKNVDRRLTATVNGVETGALFSRRYALIPTDLLNTDTYNIRVSTGIKKTSVATNSVIWNWIKNDCAGAANGVPQVLRSSVVMANGNVKYTYLVYTTGMTKNYTVTANPTGSATELNLELLFDESGKALGTNDAKYALWLVTVEAEPSVAVNFSIKKDGAETAPVVTDAAQDPHFTYCGTLDADLVRYLDEINTELVTRINACTTVGELEALLEEIKLLLTTHKNLDDILTTANFTVLADFVDTLNLKDLNYALLCATSTASVNHLGYDDEGVKTVDVTQDYVSGEAYVLLDSPFKLYNAWLQSNGYIPKK
ncbi:MAG: hypothetical protein J5885_05580 [Clostridia bacterium]|nr:hypothetical protein [Clostridia bacterium]